MKIIKFENDIYGLTDAVISGAKTQDVRPATASQLKKILGLPSHADFTIDELAEGCRKDQYALSLFAPYAKGEEVAIAQPLSAIEHNVDFIKTQIFCQLDNIGIYNRKGNKKSIRAELLPHRIRITDVRIERLQDISDEDCLKEGIQKVNFAFKKTRRVQLSLRK